MKTIIVIIAVFFLSACSIFKPDEGSNLDIGIKVAIIADTQLTTKALKEEYGFRSVNADRFSNVAIRTTAQEFLALENLEYFFNDMRQYEPDIVLYLGDGMNSGCKDEVDDFFLQLAKSRKELDKPIFFVIGNHDYLATGNQTNTDVRLKTCGSNNDIYSKSQLVTLVETFNAISYRDFSDKSIFLGFKDNIGAGIENEAWESSVESICDQLNIEDQHKTGCFYTGIIEYEKNGIKGQIILTDTSDYRDIAVQPEVVITELYGVRGSISWKKDSQLSWINDNASGDYSDVRIIASHYPIDSLGYTGLKVGRPGDLLLEGNNRNLWLSAHTHIPDPNEGSTTNKFSDTVFNVTKTTTQLNVGSTTDFKPHFAIVESKDKRVSKKSYPTDEDYSDLQCETLVNTIELDSSYLPTLNKSNATDVMLGLSGDYRESGYSTENARFNLEHFLSTRSTKEREHYVRCFIYLASKAESGQMSLLAVFDKIWK